MNGIEYTDDGTGSELILLLRLGLGELDTGRRVVRPHVHVEVSDAVGGHRGGLVAQALHSHRELVLFETMSLSPLVRLCARARRRRVETTGARASHPSACARGCAAHEDFS